MTESALEKARRELLIGVASLVAGVDLKHWPPAAASEHHAKLNEAIACLEAAAREEERAEPDPDCIAHDWRRQMEAYGYDSVAKVTDLIAAARLAGKIEQAQWVIDMMYREDCELFLERVEKERDELQRQNDDLALVAGAVTGWRCPSCGRCYSPFTAACGYCGPVTIMQGGTCSQCTCGTTVVCRLHAPKPTVVTS